MLIEAKERILSSGIKVEIRSAAACDAESLCRHRTITAGETYYMARYPEECRFDIGSMQMRLDRAANHACEFLVTAFVNGQVIGDLMVTQICDHLKYRHRAYLAISIQRDYCNLGLGSAMLEIAIEQARKNGFEQLELGVFADNERAIHLYEKHGFQSYGICPRAFKLKDGTYRDEIIMVKML